MHGARLEREFAISNALSFQETTAGLVRAVISTREAEGALYLQGAHIAHWAPKGQRAVLFVSSKSLFVPGKAIRGGVPIIFPWFGAREDGKPGPSHGFARSMEWTLEGTGLREDGAVELQLGLTPTDATREMGYDSFRLRMRAAFGSALDMSLEVTNESSEAFRYEEALHTYFAIGDVARVEVSGLEHTEYIDKTDGFRRKQQGDTPVRIGKETDQVHLNTQSTCVVNDPVWQRRIGIEKSGSDSTVVWNPWVEKTKALSDMAPDDWRGMICVETANAADNAVTLEPGGSHVLRARLRVE